MRARHVLVTSLLVALPGLLWQVFEMYGLTLGGTQMLFFSIVHTMPVAVVLVLPALPAGLLVLVQAAVSCFRPGYRNRLGLSKVAAGTLAGFLVMHFVALFAYDEWSSLDSLRVPICITGIAFAASAILLTAISLATSVPSPRTSSDA